MKAYIKYLRAVLQHSVSVRADPLGEEHDDLVVPTSRSNHLQQGRRRSTKRAGECVARDSMADRCKERQRHTLGGSRLGREDEHGTSEVALKGENLEIKLPKIYKYTARHRECVYNRGTTNLKDVGKVHKNDIAGGESSAVGRLVLILI